MQNKIMKTSKQSELELMSLKGKPYMQVAYRLVWLNDDQPNFMIETTFPLLTSEETVCHATVTLLDAQGKFIKRATGTKRETKKEFHDHTEKAETGAVGRCLAMLGFGTQFAIQDMDEGDRIVDTPVKPARRPVEKKSKTESKSNQEDF